MNDTCPIDLNGYITTTFDEVALLASRIKAIPQMGRMEQLVFLTSTINIAAPVLASPIPASQLGLPLVKVTYRKVTNCKSRSPGKDYKRAAGLQAATHIGRIIKVARNKQDGHIVLTIDDINRAPRNGEGEEKEVGFTAVRLEGLRSFTFADPLVRRGALKRLKDGR